MNIVISVVLGQFDLLTCWLTSRQQLTPSFALLDVHAILSVVDNSPQTLGDKQQEFGPHPESEQPIFPVAAPFRGATPPVTRPAHAQSTEDIKLLCVAPVRHLLG